MKSKIKLYINDQPIENVESVKNLGLCIDESFKFSNHVTQLARKCYLSLKLLYSQKHILTYNMKKTLCQSLVLSKLQYCSMVYFPCLSSIDAYRLQRIQNNYCRLILNKRKYDHISSAFETLKWLKLNKLFKLRILTSVKNIVDTTLPFDLFRKLNFRNSMHDLNIRHKKMLTMPNHKTAMFRKSFTYNSVCIFNNLRKDIQTLFFLCSSFKFKSSLKNYLLLEQQTPSLG